MKFTLSWLREFLDTNATINEICNSLTDIGLEVEEVTNPGANLKDFKAAQVIKTEKHPDADKLNICEVKTHEGNVTLICGAPNVRAGLKVVLAPIGSIIPTNGLKIKKAKIRGVASCGMLCSASELGIGNDSEGIIELPDNTEIGTALIDIFNLNDPCIEIAITPNRGDCLSVYGIARDLAAAGIGTLKTITAPEYKADFESDIKISSSDPAFRQFNLIEINNIQNHQSPKWLTQKLETIGVNTHSAIVDITNYILFSFGQPLHAYDKNKINGNFILRKAQENEEFVCLNEKTHKLTQHDFVIADEQKINALAGIIGGLNSSTQETTKAIYLEAAEFDHVAIARTGRKHQIITDSRFRFEREIDSANVTFYLRYAAKLIQEICGGEISEISQITPNVKKAAIIKFPFPQIAKTLGIEIPLNEINKILTSLNFTNIKTSKDEISVTAPLYRNDISEAHDVIEEIIRIYNLNNIPEIAFSYKTLNSDLATNEGNFNYHHLLSSLGLNEVINYSFISEAEALNFAAQDQLAPLANALNIDLKYLRPSIIPSLLRNLESRQVRSNFTINLFEKGKTFNRNGDEIIENNSIATIRSGPRQVKELNNDDTVFDIFDVKNDLIEILKEAGIPTEKLQYSTDSLPSYVHTGRSALVYLGKNLVGIFGELHPRINNKFDAKYRINFCEVFLDNLPPIKTKKSPAYIPCDLQQLTRDFAFTVAKEVNAGDIKTEINKIAKPLVQDIYIFDQYTGDKLEEGTKSLAFNLVLQPTETDLNAAELEKFNQKIIAHIINKFNATMR